MNHQKVSLFCSSHNYPTIKPFSWFIGTKSYLDKSSILWLPRLYNGARSVLESAISMAHNVCSNVTTRMRSVLFVWQKKVNVFWCLVGICVFVKGVLELLKRQSQIVRFVESNIIRLSNIKALTERKCK